MLMAQLAGRHRLFEAMRQTSLHADHAFVENLPGLIREPMRLGFQQTTGL